MTRQRMVELLEIEKECVRRNACGECNRACHICDLLQDDTELHEMYEEVIALVKAQEPRVMTLDEAQTALHNDTVVWAELKGKLICAGIHMDGTDYFMMQNDDVLDVTDFDSGEGSEVYGKQARCWTSRPTDEQREATPWA